ncbi:MAG: TetR/AcrR family transcriptional regulator [Planctomycetota bacterium]
MAQLGRPREFDVDEALDKAMDAFWARGYEATSVADLMGAMGLQKGSIYKAFGDKHSLFLRALDRYLDEVIEAVKSAISSAPDERMAVRGWLSGVVAGRCSRSNRRRGCFAINSLVELAPHDPEVNTRLRRHLEQLRGLIVPVVAAGQSKGLLRDNASAEAATDMLIAFVQGIVADARLGRPAEHSSRLMETVLGLVEAK